MFGGHQGSPDNFTDYSDFDDTWEYDITTHQWEPILEGEGPEGNLASGMTYIGGDRALYNNFGETWEYDAGERKWTNY